MSTGAADLSKLRFHTGINYLKRSTICGTKVINTAVSGTLTIPHNLGYVPFYQVGAELDEAGTIWVGEKISEHTEQDVLSSAGVMPYIEIDSWITTTDLTIRLSNTAGQSVPVYYLIYLDYKNA